MFIVFEGIDGAGTTTQAEKLRDWLGQKGFEALATGEPTANPIGKIVREVLQKKWRTSPEALQLLFCADRADHLTREIEPSLAENKIIISDRYVWSTLAFGTLACPLNWLKNLNASFRAPDFLFYLRISPKKALERIGKRGNTRELFEQEEFLVKVLKNYEELIREPFFTKTKIIVLDGEKGIEELSAEVFATIEAGLKSV